VLSLFSCPHTPHTLRPSPRTPLGHRPPHAPGIVARKPFSARFWSVPARETHTTPPHKHWPRHPRIVQCPFLPDPATKDAQRPWRNILTGEDEHILPPADDVNVHTPDSLNDKCVVLIAAEGAARRDEGAWTACVSGSGSAPAGKDVGVPVKRALFVGGVRHSECRGRVRHASNPFGQGKGAPGGHPDPGRERCL